MDQIISSALEGICEQGRAGLALSSLCSELNLSIELKRALWNNLLKIPAVQFQARNRVYDSDDPSIRCFDDVEKLDLTVVAKEKLRDNFLGVYDFSLGADEKEFRQQRLTLERIATASTNGITQSQLSKEFGMEGNKTFYVVKKLEKSGLIVRQEAVERTRATGTGNQGQSTRLIHLRRYAKNLGSQQKFEITKGEHTMANPGSNVDQIKQDVLVKDYAPSMKAICDKLEEAKGKVLTISDVKHDLGYRGSRSKHRWKNVCGRLINAGLVEETCIKVNKKDELCLRLLKGFPLMDFEQKTIKYVEGKELKFGRCQRANQLVELPIDHQIYDAIDAAGFEGMLIKEVSQRFGIDQKTNLKNCYIMSNKFGMPMQRELHNKNCEYRIRTARNCESSNEIPSRSKNLLSKNFSLAVFNPGSEGPAQVLHLSNSENDTPGKTNNWETEREISRCSPRGHEAIGSISNTCKSRELIHGTKTLFPNRGHHSVNTATMTLKPCSPLTVDSTRREQRILELLEVDKIVLKVELYKWLVSLEKDKGTTMDRKTVDRILYKLENRGQCKCIHLAGHELINTDVNRKVKVVLHASIQSLSSEVLGRVRDRLLSFGKQTHGQASFRKKNINSVLVPDGIQRTRTRDDSDTLALRMAAMRANGFTSGKMVRAKLLHSFLWEYACSSSARNGVLSYVRQDDDLQNPYGTHNPFVLEAAIKSIPLELFLQVVGSTVKVDNMIQKFKNGVCLCDLSIQEYNDLNDTRAIRRLSSILSILQRLKLIRLVTSGSSDDGVIGPNAYPVYTMEVKPYIEEPPLTETYSNSGSLDLFLNRDIVHEITRHDFFLSDRDAIDDYWQVLEYTYAVADPKAAWRAFPGSTVHEIFGHRSWATGRGMTAGQHAKVLKFIGKRNFNEDLPYKECKKIAKNLNLPLHQVLHVHYAKLRRRKKFQDNLNATEAERKPMHSFSFSRKRKISAKARALKHRKIDNEIGPLCQHILPRSAGTDKDFMEEENLMLADPGEDETQLQEHQKEGQGMTSEKPGVTKDKYHHSASYSSFSKTKSLSKRRFLWTDEEDRQLIIQYVKRRVDLGEKFKDEGRVSFCDPPAPQKVCKRRMLFLKQNRNFRDSLKGLCNMLSKRYEKHQEETESRPMNDDDLARPVVPCSSRAGNYRSAFESTKCNKNKGAIQEEQCDSFNEEEINLALEEVLQSRQVDIMEAPRKPGDVCDSLFPSHTGSNAAKFSSWLHEHEKDFMRGGIDLSLDLQCGEIFHLFALVSSGELFISPCLPVEGVGEAEHTRSLKQASHFSDSCDIRREKGFPGIKLSVHRAPMRRAAPLESSFKNREKRESEHFPDGNYTDGISASLNVGRTPSHNLNLGKTAPEPGDSCNKTWEMMVGYATQLMPLPPNEEHAGTLSTEVFKAVYAAIQKAGDQGLALREVSRVMDTLGEKMTELVIDVLQKFGRAKKVRINGSLHAIAESTEKPLSLYMDGNDTQKLTILNHHEDGGDAHAIKSHEDSMQGNVLLPEANNRHDLPEGCKHYDAKGISKKNIHKRIISQTFRIVMQNPGILEDDIVRKMNLPDPQLCKKLLRLMVLDKHLIVKKHQSTPNGVPSILRNLLGGNNLKESKLIYREHFFANPLSTSLL